MNSKQSKEDTMNMFTKRTAPISRNTVPLTLSMVEYIDPNTRKLDNFLEVNKVVVLVKVLNITHRMGGKIELEVIDESDGKTKVIHCYRPKFASEELDVNENEYYTFVCLVKADHGQIIMTSVKSKKVQSQEEIDCHNLKISLAELYRQKRLKEIENDANNASKVNQYNEFDI